MALVSNALRVAILQSSLDEVRRLIDQASHCLDDLNEHGDSVLILAASCGHAEIVRHLLYSGAKVNLSGRNNWTPLHHACHVGSLEAVQYLIAAHADPVLETDQNESAMDVALSACKARGHDGAARLLGDLNRAPKLCSDVICAGNNAGAVLGFDQIRKQYLVARLDGSCVIRADPTSLTFRQWDWVVLKETSSHSAAQGARGTTMQAWPITSRQVSSSNARFDRTIDPVRCCSAARPSGGLPDTSLCVRHLLFHRATPHHCRRAHARESFRARGPMVDSHAPFSTTVLERESYQHKVSMFLQRAADRENSPLHAAAAMGHVALVRRLLANGVPVDVTTASGMETALHLAAGSGVIATTSLLLSASAAVNACNLDGDRPLHVAAWAGDDRTLQALLEGHADVNASGHLGERSITTAAIRSQVEAVRLLLEYDADVGLSDDLGRAPLEAAKQHGAPMKITRLLIPIGEPLPNASDSKHVHDGGSSSSSQSQTHRNLVSSGIVSGDSMASLAALPTKWQDRARALLPHSRRVLILGDSPECVPGGAILMEAMSTNLASDLLDKWRQACATFTEGSGAAMLQVPAALGRAQCMTLRHGVNTNGTVNNDTVI